MKMKKSTLVVFISYTWLKTLSGLTFHPYISTRNIVRRPVLFPVVFSPLIGLAILFVAGRIAAAIITTYGTSRQIIAILLGTILFSIVFWQLLILYLLGSFLFALWVSKKS